MTNKKFAELFDGPPRKPESRLTQREMDIARSIQEVTEEIMLKMAHQVKKETREQYLCLAGGVALNCVETVNYCVLDCSKISGYSLLLAMPEGNRRCIYSISSLP